MRSIGTMMGVGLAVAAALAVTAPAARAQGYGPPAGGGSVYLPFAGAGGGFIPYSYAPGATGGLGVQPGVFQPMVRVSPPLGAPATAGGLGTGRELGALGTMLPPPTPFGVGLGGGLIRRPRFGVMRAPTVRPPVGGYPFRPPTSFGVSGASAPAGM